MTTQQPMQYVSTRGGMPSASFSDILLGGLAPDGGLTLPDHYPQITHEELNQWRALTYQDLAYEILTKFISDIPANDLKKIIDSSYTAEIFSSPDITPLTELEPNLYLLELSNGPTLAFKDMAMQLLGNLFEYVLAQRGQSLTIVGATSGDTGSSAEYALRGKRGVRVFMLSPLGKMTPFQTAQMYSLQDPNIFNIAVRGVFDDCQDMVKAISNDHAFKQRFSIGAVNSINWARVLAQVVYYFKGYFLATQSSSQSVSFAVPSGNFGNICAGHIARMMGLPIRRLILATNENNVLDDFFRTGVYRPRASAATVQTSSPSMDISKASNFERFIYDLVGRDAGRVRELWQDLADKGFFDLTATGEFARVGDYGFVSGSSTHQDRLHTIRKVWERYGRMIDPHTADGFNVGATFQEDGIPLICLETALPAKFEQTTQEALGQEPSRPAKFVGLEQLPQRYETMDPDVATLQTYIAKYAGSDH